MYLINLLEAEHSANQMQTIVSYIGTSQKRFETPLKFSYPANTGSPKEQPGLSVISAAAHPQLINKHFVANL